MRDMSGLAELSHSLDRVAFALCGDDENDGRIEAYLVELADGEQEALAVALSYALRRRELSGPGPGVDRAVSTLAGALRRMVSRA
ncbi:MAG: hypothetical protein M3P34_05500 [Actinomycetota bacterium]|nr:hypothetical protein [Actinomycetota bacterium]